MNKIGDMALGASGASSPVWYPALQGVNEIAAVVTIAGGAVLILIRIYCALLDAIEKRKKISQQSANHAQSDT